MMEDGACSIIDVLPAGFLHARPASMLIQRDACRFPCMGGGCGTYGKEDPISLVLRQSVVM